MMRPWQLHPPDAHDPGSRTRWLGAYWKVQLPCLLIMEVAVSRKGLALLLAFCHFL